MLKPSTGLTPDTRLHSTDSPTKKAIGKWTPLRRRIALLFGTFALAAIGVVLLRPVDAYYTLDRVLLWIAGFESRNVQLGSHRIHYYAGGEGKPLVLVHGLGGRALSWRPVMTGMAGKYRVIVPDLLGFGESDKPQDADYSIARQTELLKQFMDSQQLQKADVAGWSMGGWISLNFASKWPERVERLMLLDSAGVRFEPDFDPGILHPDNREQVLAMLRILPAPIPPRFIQRDLFRHMQERHWVVERSVNSMLTGHDAMDGKLATVTMPVLLLWGKNDGLTPLVVARRMLHEMPQARLITFDGCGHLAPVECPDEVVPALQKFLSE